MNGEFLELYKKLSTDLKDLKSEMAGVKAEIVALKMDFVGMQASDKEYREGLDWKQVDTSCKIKLLTDGLQSKKCDQHAEKMKNLNTEMITFSKAYYGIATFVCVSIGAGIWKFIELSNKVSILLSKVNK